MNNINKIVKLALDEDIGSGDASASLLDSKQTSANIISRENAVLCGAQYANSAFLQLDSTISIDWKAHDGDKIVKDQIICSITGDSKSIITAERVALNFLQTLSSTATQTDFLVKKIAHTSTKLLDTRKTIPNLRQAQKYAVKCGGGVNHRIGLYDAVMLKENHIIANGSIASAVNSAKQKYPKLDIIVEVEDIDQLKEVLAIQGVTRILCDNFTVAELSDAVVIAKDIYPLEASGNIDENNIAEFAETGVDYISTGSITKNVQAIDFSLRFI